MSSIGLFFVLFAVGCDRAAAMNVFKDYGTPLYQHLTIRIGIIVLLIEVVVYIIVRSILMMITIRRYKRKIADACTQSILDDAVYFSGAPKYTTDGLEGSLSNALLPYFNNM
uniref:ABC transmembrane type-1 domain-containing protein n=1 Tax=Steinernema glaseri TaxID=37863 RepID=A0A1I8AVS5_9BILA